MKKKLILAVLLLAGFAALLSIFSKESVQTVKETTIKSRPIANNDTITYSGENDFWKARFSVSKKSKNQLNLSHKKTDGNLPQLLTFTLSTAYDKAKKETQIGVFHLSFRTFPETFSLAFDEDRVLSTDSKKLVLKITGKDHYQFFYLYLED
jgi:hypothetical protein